MAFDFVDVLKNSNKNLMKVKLKILISRKLKKNLTKVKSLIPLDTKKTGLIVASSCICTIIERSAIVSPINSIKKITFDTLTSDHGMSL